MKKISQSDARPSGTHSCHQGGGDHELILTIEVIFEYQKLIT